MPPELDDLEEEVVNIGSEGDDTTTEAEDRGDVVDPGVNPAALQAVVDGAVADDEQEDEDALADGKPGSQGIPRARFNEVNEQRKEFQRRYEDSQRELEQLRGRAPAQVQAPEVEPFDVDAKEKAYIDALLEGDREAASTIRREINAHIQDQADARAEGVLSRRQSFTALQTVTSQTLEAYPWLDEPGGAEALELIVALRDKKIAGGMAPANALAEAVNRIAPKFAPAEDLSPGREVPNSGVPADNRAKKSLLRGAADAVLQPPAVQAGIGNRTTGGRIDVNNLTEEQFDNLTAAEKKKLRGD